MKTLTKFVLSAALCGVFAGCGGDSGSNSGSSELPESIKNFSDIADYDCNDARQCAKLYIEEYDDYMQCVDGSWETLISSMKNACSEVILGSSQNQQSSSSEVSSSSAVAVVDPSSVVKGTMTDERDGQVYKTVTIGEQTWMAQNLNYAYNVPTTKWDSSSFCYDNEPDSCAKYGRLYLWSAAIDSAAVFSDDGKGCGYYVTCSFGRLGVTVRGVCPEGWHLPNLKEWYTLFTAVGGDSTAGTVLISTSGWASSGNGEDSYGFSVLPAGIRDSGDSGKFYNAGDIARFWSARDFDRYAYELSFSIYDNNAIVCEYKSLKSLAFSVRCVKD